MRFSGAAITPTKQLTSLPPGACGRTYAPSGARAFAYRVDFSSAHPSLLLAAAELVGGARFGYVRRRLRFASYDVAAEPHWATNSVVLFGTSPYSSSGTVDAVVEATCADLVSGRVLASCRQAVRSASLGMAASWTWRDLDLVELISGWLGAGYEIDAVPRKIDVSPEALCESLGTIELTRLHPAFADAPQRQRSSVR